MIDADSRGAASSTRGPAHRLVVKVRQEGLRPTVAAAARRLRHAVWLRESHVWLLIGLDEPRPRPRLAPDLHFVRVPDQDVDSVAQLGASVATAGRRLARGHQLFATRQGARTVGVVWAFLGEAPTVVMPTGWLPLPDGYVNVEDTLVAPDQRGKGIAPAQYSLTFDDLRDKGFTHVVGKVPVDNVANRRACAKLGWTEVAVVDLLRVLGWRRVSVRALGTGRDVSWLAAAATDGTVAGAP